MSNRASSLTKEELPPTPRCIVLFRPHTSYEGEYGFDWIRKASENVKTINGTKGNDVDSVDLLGTHINTGCTKAWTCSQLNNCIDQTQNPNNKCLDTAFLISKVNFSDKQPANSHCKSRPQIGTDCSQSTNCFDATANPQQKCTDYSKYLALFDNINKYCSPCGAACFSEVLNPTKVCQDPNSWSQYNFQKDKDAPAPNNGLMLRSLKRNFKPSTAIVGFIDHDYQVPILTVMPDSNNNNPITIKMMVFIKDKALETGLFWKSSTDIFTLAFPNSINKNDIDKWQEVDFTLKCEKTFSRDEMIEVFYDNPAKNDSAKLCGRLRVLANDTPHQKKENVVLVRVSVDIGNGGTTGSFANDEKALENILKQGYVFIKNSTGSFIYEDLNLATWVSDFINLYVDSSVTPKKLKYDGTLLDFLNSKLDSKYNDYLKVYSFEERCAGYGGFALSNKKACVIFKGRTKETAPHELLHVFKMPHTFVAKEIVKESDVASKLKTYEAKKTDNVMDYSHLSGIKTINTFYWQWTILNPNIS